MRLLLRLKQQSTLWTSAELPLSLAAKHGTKRARCLRTTPAAQDHASKSRSSTPKSARAHLWFHAAKQGDVKALRRLLGRQIGAQGDEGFRESTARSTTLRARTCSGSTYRVLCNAKRGADGATALSIAVQGGHVEAVTYLLSLPT